MVNLKNNNCLSEIDKQRQYEIVLRSLRSIVYSDNKLINTLNIVASMLYDYMSYTWIGFYTIHDGELRAATFRGPTMQRKVCTTEGACGLAFTKECTVIVDEVEQFSKYIPRDTFEKSEIALPAFKKGELALILNVGSDQVKYFNKTDRFNLQQLMHLLEEVL